MKTRSILIALAAMVMLLAGTAFLLRSTRAAAGRIQAMRFLNKFNNQVESGNTDSVLTCFAKGKDEARIARLARLLAGVSGTDDKKQPLFGTCLAMSSCALKMTDNNSAEATIPVAFKRNSLAGGQSSITLQIQETPGGQYQVVKADARKFLSDYERYENSVKQQAGAEGIYNLVSRMAHQNAVKLKARYDSVLWLGHANYQTYYYVAKGDVDLDYYYRAG